jgi:hypothetical protein
MPFIYSFLRANVTFAQNNARLEDRIAALLQDEKLTGDNKFVIRWIVYSNTLLTHALQVPVFAMRVTSGCHTVY